jgi:periplasmic protein TonB
MLAYAATKPAAVRKSSPNALLIVISAHVALVAAVMSAKMELPPRFIPDRTEVTFVPLPKQPTPPPRPSAPTHTAQSWVDHPIHEVDLPPIPKPQVDLGGTPAVNPGPGAGGGSMTIADLTPPKPLKLGPALLTPASELRPPYPQSKLLSEEEAVLSLRLTIDERGRVIAVQPVGRADPVFLEAARRYLIAHWRYRPASENGRAVASSMVITLRFQLDG